MTIKLKTDLLDWIDTNINTNKRSAITGAIMNSGLHDIVDSSVNEGNLDSKEPNGFPNRTDTTISFTDSTRTFTIEPTGTSYAYYCDGIKYPAATGAIVVLPDTEGEHYIYYDGANLTSTTTFSSNIITDKAITSIVYWDATNKESVYFADERHGIKMDGQTHAYLHLIHGAQYQSGGTLSGITADGTGNTNSDLTFALTQTIIWDEDILHVLAAKLVDDAVPKIYMTDTGAWRMVGETDAYPGYTGGSGRLKYNNTAVAGGLSEVTNNQFMCTHILFTNDIRNPYYVLLGNTNYNTANAARAGARGELSTIVTAGLPFAEFVFAYTLILQTNDTYTSAIKAKIVSIDGENYVDWRQPPKVPFNV